MVDYMDFHGYHYDDDGHCLHHFHFPQFIANSFTEIFHECYHEMQLKCMIMDYLNCKSPGCMEVKTKLEF